LAGEPLHSHAIRKWAPAAILRGALKMLDVKMTDQMTGREIAGHENAGMK